MQIAVSQGQLNVKLRRLDPGDAFEIDTPNSVFTLLQPGSYSVSVQSEEGSSITVWNGQAEVTAAGNDFTVPAGQEANVSGLGSIAYYTQPVSSPDAWDAWCADRDAREDQLVSVRYVPREMIGVEDLDANGSWTVMAGYGAVWAPYRVPAGWAPYRHGRWAWVAPWGWTWIDEAPWGFAPFHYGRWAFLNARWVWIPGTVVARPVYAPALVVFIGGGPVTVGAGNRLVSSRSPRGLRASVRGQHDVRPAGQRDERHDHQRADHRAYRCHQGDVREPDRAVRGDRRRAAIVHAGRPGQRGADLLLAGPGPPRADPGDGRDDRSPAGEHHRPAFCRAEPCAAAAAPGPGRSVFGRIAPAPAPAPFMFRPDPLPPTTVYQQPPQPSWRRLLLLRSASRPRFASTLSFAPQGAQPLQPRQPQQPQPLQPQQAATAASRSRSRSSICTAAAATAQGPAFPAAAAAPAGASSPAAAASARASSPGAATSARAVSSSRSINQGQFSSSRSKSAGSRRSAAGESCSSSSPRCQQQPQGNQPAPAARKPTATSSRGDPAAQANQQQQQGQPAARQGGINSNSRRQVIQQQPQGGRDNQGGGNQSEKDNQGRGQARSLSTS